MSHHCPIHMEVSASSIHDLIRVLIYNMPFMLHTSIALSDLAGCVTCDILPSPSSEYNNHKLDFLNTMMTYDYSHNPTRYKLYIHVQ